MGTAVFPDSDAGWPDLAGMVPGAVSGHWGRARFALFQPVRYWDGTTAQWSARM